MHCFIDPFFQFLITLPKKQRTIASIMLSITFTKAKPFLSLKYNYEAYMKWVVKIMVFPALCFSNKSQVPLLAYGSIPEVGSSKNTVSDPPMRAIAQLQKRN